MWAKYFSSEHACPFRGSLKVKKSRNISNTYTNTLPFGLQELQGTNKMHQKFFQKQIHNVKSRPFKCTHPRKGARTFQHRLYEKNAFLSGALFCSFLGRLPLKKGHLLKLFCILHLLDCKSEILDVNWEGCT